MTMDIKNTFQLMFDMIKFFGSLIMFIFFTYIIIRQMRESHKQREIERMRMLHKVDYENYTNYDFRKN